jgi:hypothetical protein
MQFQKEIFFSGRTFSENTDSNITNARSIYGWDV